VLPEDVNINLTKNCVLTSLLAEEARIEEQHAQEGGVAKTPPLIKIVNVNVSVTAIVIRHRQKVSHVVKRDPKDGLDQRMLVMKVVKLACLSAVAVK
jgi:hypothetical protein